MASTGDGRRRVLERAWEHWRQGSAPDDDVRPEILSSWQRSAEHVTDAVAAAPLADEGETRSLFEDSPLSTAVNRLEGALRSAAEDGDLVVAVTDPQTRILWTYGGRIMRSAAEEINFVAGGRWDEGSVGTNALNLALRNDRVSTVFAAEHYAPIVHNWVCWAAPVHDPITGAQLGVLDLSTTWDRGHPIGAATAQALARLLETAIPLREFRRRPARVPVCTCGSWVPSRSISTGLGCCSPDGRARSSRCSPCTPRGSPSGNCTPTSTAMSGSRRARSRPRSATCAPRSVVASPHGPIVWTCP